MLFVRKYWRLILFALLLIGAAALYREFDLGRSFTPAGRNVLAAKADELGLKGMLAYIAIYVVFVTLGLPNLPFQLLAGAIYGMWRGVLLMYVGVNIGALTAFTLARVLGRRGFENFFGEK